MSAEFSRNFDAVWTIMLEDMDENADEVVHILEYGTYTTRMDLEQRFESLWCITGHGLSRLSKGTESRGAWPSSPGAGRHLRDTRSR